MVATELLQYSETCRKPRLYLVLLTLGAHAQRGLLFLCLCLCLSVKSHLTYGASVSPENAVTYSAAKNICNDLPETTAFESYAVKHERKAKMLIIPTYPRSVFSARHTAKHQRVPNDCQPHSFGLVALECDVYITNWHCAYVNMTQLCKSL